MQTPTYSLRYLQQRRFYTVLPVLALPFVTVLFWILIGKNLNSARGCEKDQKGLLLSLPQAIFKGDSALNKLDYYHRAAADSARLRDLISKDPYYVDTAFAAPAVSSGASLKGLGSSTKRRARRSPALQSQESARSQEQLVHQKLAALNQALAHSPAPDLEGKPKLSQGAPKSSASKADMTKLEAMMAGLDEDILADQPDPEMAQLNDMLDKILKIQNPEQTMQELEETPQKQQHQAISLAESRAKGLISVLETSVISVDSAKAATKLDSAQSQTDFYSLDEPQASQDAENAIEAVIDESQQLVTGASVKLRLSKDAYVAGVLMAAGQPVYGKASLSGERLQIAISSIKTEGSLIPVKLSVYDLDGQQGIYVPGAIARQVGKQSSDRAIQSLNIPMLDPSIGAQAASAGITAAKTFLGRKVKLTQVSLKAGYRVLLVDGNKGSI